MNMMSAVAAAPAVGLSIDPAPADAAVQDDGQEAYENGLDVARTEFALVWLQQWTGAGGSVTMDTVDPDKAWIGTPMFDLSTEYPDFEQRLAAMRATDWFTKQSEDWQQRHEQDNHSTYSNRYDGKMRGLYDLLASTPTLLGYVKQIVTIAPHLGLPSSAKGV